MLKNSENALKKTGKLFKARIINKLLIEKLFQLTLTDIFKFVEIGAK